MNGRRVGAMVRRGDVPAGYGISDAAALLFEDGRLVEAVGADAAAGAWRVETSGDRLCETALPVRRLVAESRAVPGRVR